MKTLYILSALGVIAMLAEIFRFKKFVLPVVLVGLLGAIAVAIKDWNTDIHYYNNMMTFDNYAILFSILICGVAFLWFLFFQDFFNNESSGIDHYALVLFSICGAMLMVSYSNMVMLFLGIEILSIPLYVLAGSKKDSLASNEAALKYFLMGAFASGFLLFGITLIYGGTGSFDIVSIGRFINSSDPTSVSYAGSEPLIYSGILLMLVGLCFKAAAVPFHFWTPDVYEGSPTPITTFMATIVKIAAFGAFLRLFLTCFSVDAEVWSNTIWVIAAISILLGNITAVYQKGIKRMLAYSSVAHAGYLMLALLANGSMSAGAVLYYAAAYSLATLSAFAILSILENSPSYKNRTSFVSFDSFAGLSKQNPFLALAMAISMISLAGIPPLAGFFGKYYLFTAVLKSGYVWLVLLAVLGSLIGVYYYFKVIIKMYSTSPSPQSEENSENIISVSFIQKSLLILILVLIILLGVFPDLIIGLI